MESLVRKNESPPEIEEHSRHRKRRKTNIVVEERSGWNLSHIKSFLNTIAAPPQAQTPPNQACPKQSSVLAAYPSLIEPFAAICSILASAHFDPLILMYNVTVPEDGSMEFLLKCALSFGAEHDPRIVESLVGFLDVEIEDVLLSSNISMPAIDCSETETEATDRQLDGMRSGTWIRETTKISKTPFQYNKQT